jgi:hypothetical protein
MLRNPAVKFFENIFFDAFRLRVSIEEKHDELFREDIIEKVDEPTPWVNPVVVMRSGYVWICGVPTNRFYRRDTRFQLLMKYSKMCKREVFSAS